MDYRRRLPHQIPDGRDVFLTWCLAGCLPKARYPPPGKASSGDAFAWMDRYLDTTRSGPTWLKDPRVAGIAESAIERAVSEAHFVMHAYVVMPNHVHMLVTPIEKPVVFMRLLKGRSARAANLVLGRTGAFWLGESYDHWIRDAEEWRGVRAYIEENPVVAGLVGNSEEYRWLSSSAKAEAAG